MTKIADNLRQPPAFAQHTRRALLLLSAALILAIQAPAVGQVWNPNEDEAYVYHPHCHSYRHYWTGWGQWQRRCVRYHHPRHYHARYHTPRLEYDRDVEDAQHALRDLVCRHLEVDGLLGPDTRHCLRKLQRDEGLEVTGDLDRRTEAFLRDRAPGRRGGVAGWHRDRDEAWSRRPAMCTDRESGRECTCDPVIAFSGEHKFRDGKKLAFERWRGQVRALLGELYMDWSKAIDQVEHCWHSATGERSSDIGQTRCVVQARACFGPPAAFEGGAPTAGGTQ